VKKLHARASGYQYVSIIFKCTPGEKQDEWSQALSAGSDEAQDEIGQAWVVDPDDFFELRLHQEQVGPHGGKEGARPDINHRLPRTERTRGVIPATPPIT